MSRLSDKLKKNSTIKETSLLGDSILYKEKTQIETKVPMINVALSARLNGGVSSGFTMIAGPSRHFKTAFALLMAATWLEHDPEAEVLFYDTEFGTPRSYIESFNIDQSRVTHTPITDIEQLKHDMMVQINGIDREDKLLILVDSLGNIASKKEVDDALDGKVVVDMTRAKAMKSLFRMVTPHLTLKDIPMIGINHTYKTLEMYSKDQVGGGTGGIYAADNIWIVGRRQRKEGKDTGNEFVIRVEKSRFVKEGAAIPIDVTYEKGIDRYSGLWDIAVENDLIIQSGAWYQRVDPDTGEIDEIKVRRDDIINDKSFWKSLLQNKSIQDYVYKKYSISTGPIMTEEDQPEMAPIEE